MTQEDKKLLLTDLSARLRYGVICEIDLKPYKLKGINKHKKLWWFEFDGFRSIEAKPYLRPMSSMTEEEKVQLSQYACIGEDLNGEFIDEVQRKDCATYIDWLNKNHFDYRDLILKGLALEAPEGMYNLK